MKKIILILTILASLFAVTSCASTDEIPSDYSAAQIMQLGQKSYDNGNYTKAEYYYSQALIKFGMDTPIYVECRYEIGHIAIRTKDYATAYRSFTEILDIYASYPAGTLSPSYKTLAQKGLSQIPEDELKKLSKK